ncbi:MAG: hypothetical protein ABFR90_10335 [Planctomycetota bacterium]
MLRGMGLNFKAANTNDPAWKWANNPTKSDKKDAHRLAMMYHHGFFPEVHIPCIGDAAVKFGPLLSDVVIPEDSCFDR